MFIIFVRYVLRFNRLSNALQYYTAKYFKFGENLYFFFTADKKNSSKESMPSLSTCGRTNTSHLRIVGGIPADLG